MALRQFSLLHRILRVMSAIDSLESRVAELEKQMYGSNSVPSIDDPLPENCMVDSLLHANTLIASALSGRDKTNALVKRLPELNEMLDPSYDGIDLHAEAKLELVMAMESDIREYARSVDRLDELKPVLELDRMKDVPDLMPKLNQLTLNYLACHKESEVLTKNIWNVFSEYNNIITSIAKTLISLDAAVTAAEIAAAPKKQLD